MTFWKAVLFSVIVVGGLAIVYNSLLWICRSKAVRMLKGYFSGIALGDPLGLQEGIITEVETECRKYGIKAGEGITQANRTETAKAIKFILGQFRDKEMILYFSITVDRLHEYKKFIKYARQCTGKEFYFLELKAYIFSRDFSEYAPAEYIGEDRQKEDERKGAWRDAVGILKALARRIGEEAEKNGKVRTI